MQGKEEKGGFIVLKLAHGEDLFECLNKAIKKFKIKSGFVVLGLGMLAEVEIGYFSYKTKKYSWKKLKEPHELVALHGSISTKGETVIHLHCALANAKHQLVGGHLKSAKVCVINEILLKKLDDVVLGRKLNTETGLKEMFIE